MRYEHLLNRTFAYGKQDCYSLVREFYQDNFDILLPNFARPKAFWDHGINLYGDLYHKVGFYPLDCHPSEYRVGDVFLMAVRSEVANHVGVLVGHNLVAHHLWGRLSVAEPYRNLLRNTTVAVLRHKDVQQDQVQGTQSLLDLVSPHIKRKLDAHLGSADVL
ncbi:NlpC/P60 family protein [Rhizobium arsenicireducens]